MVEVFCSADRDPDFHHPPDLALRRTPLSGAYPIHRAQAQGQMGGEVHRPGAILFQSARGVARRNWTRQRLRKGRQALGLLLQKAKNKFDAIWTYGESVFPPSKSDAPALSEAS